MNEEAITVLFLCEQEHLILKPNQLYRFEVSPGCKRCQELAALYESNKVRKENNEGQK